MAAKTTPPIEPPAWDRDALQDPHGCPNKARRVRAMFDAIAPNYERVNRLVSLRADAGWRRKAVAAAYVKATDVVLDVCCGTGDMIRAFAAYSPPPKLLIGVDFASGMLAGSNYAGVGTNAYLVQADALRLPFADQTVDVISCAFGVRNFQDLSTGLREMCRVLRPGGRVVILEFALPHHPLMLWGYRLYCEYLLPRLAGLLSRDKTGAYRYLPHSIRTFEPCEGLARRLRLYGLAHVTTTPLAFGVVVIYRGVKPA